MIREEIFRYARSKSNQYFGITEKYIMVLVSQVLISSCDSFWNNEQMKKYLHLANNDNLFNSKTAKVDPLCHKLLLNCQQFGIFHKKLSIDENIVPYRRKHQIRQFIRNKPVRFGYKIWFTWGTGGYPYNFQIYEDKETGTKREVLGPRVVEDIASSIRHDDADKHTLCFDKLCSQAINYLTTLQKRIWE